MRLIETRDKNGHNVIARRTGFLLRQADLPDIQIKDLQHYVPQNAGELLVMLVAPFLGMPLYWCVVVLGPSCWNNAYTDTYEQN